MRRCRAAQVAGGDLPALRRRMAIGCAMKGLLAGVVKTSAAKRAPSFSTRRTASNTLGGDGKSINPNRQIAGVERRLRVIQFVRRTFKSFDILKTCASSVSAHVIQHGARNITGYHLAVRAHTHRRLDALASGTTGKIAEFASQVGYRPCRSARQWRWKDSQRIRAPTSPSQALLIPTFCEARISMNCRPSTVSRSLPQRG